MKFFKTLVVLFGFGLFLFADSKNPLFVSVTTDSVHKSTMAIQFSAKMQSKGHATTIYLTDTGVKVASTGVKEFANAQMILKDMMSKGAKVYICPMCMQTYKMEGKDMLDGVQLGNADLLESALFAPNTTTLTW